jgi:hypothetical protein
MLTQLEAQAAQVDAASSAVSTLVETKQIEDLPLNGLNCTQLELASGVAAGREAPLFLKKIHRSFEARAGCYGMQQFAPGTCRSRSSLGAVRFWGCV